MKKFLIFLFVFSMSAKAEPYFWPKIIGEAILAASAAIVPAPMNAVTAIFSDSTREFLKNNMVASDQKDKVQTELKTSTAMYSMTAVATTVSGAMMFADFHKPGVLRNKPAQIVALSAILLGLATSAVGMGLNGDVYREISPLNSTDSLDTMLRFSIATLATTVVADGIIVYRIFNPK